MKHISIFLFAILTCTVQSQTSEYLGEGPYPQLIIRGITLINGDGSPPRGPMDIVVENNVIKEMRIVGYPGV